VRTPRERASLVASISPKASATGGFVTGRDQLARPTRTGPSSRSPHEPTTWDVRAHRVGAKLSSGAIQTRGAERRKPSSAPGPRNLDWDLAETLRVFGLGASLGELPPDNASKRATAPRGSGIGRFAARARGSFWLQKSTNEAWPTRRRKGSSLEATRGRPRGARGANGLWKPPRGGEAVRTVAGSRKRAFVDGRRSDPKKSAALTRRRRNRIWLLADTGRFARERLRATRSVRGRVTSSAHGRQDHGRAAPFGGAVDRSTRQDRTTPPHGISIEASTATVR